MLCCSNSPWDWDYIVVKLGIKRHISKVGKIYIEKKIYVNRLESFIVGI